MCGIAGFSFSNKIGEKKSILKTMNDKLQHRGPDDEGFYHDEDISFAHKRLTIIDLNPRSKQPFEDKANGCIIVFNGEIYNYIELKKNLTNEGIKFFTSSDTEVLLKAYIKWGIDFLQKIKGMFSFAIYDKKKRKIICARDHFGQKPFFYYFKDGNFIFSSELTSLISNPVIEKKISYESIINYFHYDSFVGNSTPLINCYKLLPSEYIIFDIEKRNIRKNNYWNININSNKISKIDSKNIFIEKLIKSTELHLRSDVPIALYLSGGIDSTTLAVILKRKLKLENLQALNLKFKNNTFNDGFIASSTAKLLNIKLKTYRFEDDDFLSKVNNFIFMMDEPVSDGAYIANSFISDFASKEGYKVAISGTGGDELLMGYAPFTKYWFYKLLNKYSILSKPTKYISTLLPDNFNYFGLTHKIKVFCKAFGYSSLIANNNWICSFLPEEINYLTKNNFSGHDVYKYVNQIIHSINSSDEYDQLIIQYQRHFLSDRVTPIIDKSNMINTVEARSPFLDTDLLDFSNSLDKKLIINKNQSKLILRNFLKENLNNNSYKATKKGFSAPLAGWIKKELKSLVLDTLNKDNINKTGFIDYDYLHNFVIKPHLENKSNNYKKIWNIFILIKWLNNNKLL